MQLQLGQALEELDAWLNDERQWRHAGATHWKALLNDLRDRLSDLSALSEGEVQSRIDALIEEIRTLQPGFRSDGGVPDESLRRRLLRLSGSAHDIARDPGLLTSAWRRIGAWCQAGEARADSAIGILRDLARFSGHDAGRLLETVRDVLNDRDWIISSLREQPMSEDPYARSGLSATELLDLTEAVLGRPAKQMTAVVWLEYLQARLLWPLILRIGPSITLYRESFLRSIIHQAPDDERVPPELRDVNSTGLPIWLDASDPEKAVRAEYTVRGDPRVYARIELDDMPAAKALEAARETAEFLVTRRCSTPTTTPGS